LSLPQNQYSTIPIFQSSSSPLPGFDSQLPLGVADEVKIRHIRNRHWTVNTHGLLRLVDDHS
jgi:hypothetical protein